MELKISILCSLQGAHTEPGGRAVKVQSMALLFGLLRNLRVVFALPPAPDQVCCWSLYYEVLRQCARQTICEPQLQCRALSVQHRQPVLCSVGVCAEWLCAHLHVSTYPLYMKNQACMCGTNRVCTNQEEHCT